MKTKITLSKEQVDKLVAIEEIQLRVKIEKDLESIRKKYVIVEIDLDNQSKVRKNKKSKLTDKDLKKYLDKGMTISYISELTGYNASCLSKRKKTITGVSK